MRQKLITIGKRTMNVVDWCRTYGIKAATVHYRMREFGWPFEKALKTPTANPYAKSALRLACEAAGADYGIVRGRVQRMGWNVADAIKTPKLPPESPLKRGRRLVKVNGEVMTADAASRAIGGRSSLISSRLASGWKVEDAESIPPMTRTETVARRSANRRRRELASLGLIV